MDRAWPSVDMWNRTGRTTRRSVNWLGSDFSEPHLKRMAGSAPRLEFVCVLLH